MLDRHRLQQFQQELNWTDIGVGVLHAHAVGDYVHCKLLSGKCMVMTVFPGARLNEDIGELAEKIAKELRNKWRYEYEMPLLEGCGNE